MRFGDSLVHFTAFSKVLGLSSLDEEAIDMDYIRTIGGRQDYAEYETPVTFGSTGTQGMKRSRRDNPEITFDVPKQRTEISTNAQQPYYALNLALWLKYGNTTTPRRRQLFLQRYRNYGCHCFPYDQVQGKFILQNVHGEPIDPIDRACRDYIYCLQCALIDDTYDDCQDKHPDFYATKNIQFFDFFPDASQPIYEFGVFDVGEAGDSASPYWIACADEFGSCEYEKCQCDVKFAKDLLAVSQEYTRNHKRYNFPAVDTCSNKHSDSAWAAYANSHQRTFADDPNSDLHNAQQAPIETTDAFFLKGFGYRGGQLDSIFQREPEIKRTAKTDSMQCCGSPGNRVPFNTHQGHRACCNDKTYDVNRLTCCEGTLTELGNVC